jgi:hypothetical protein
VSTATEPSSAVDTAERRALVAWLQAQRDSVVAIVADLDPELAATTVVPSGWTPAELVSHLGGAEWFWAQGVLAGRAFAPEPDVEAEVEELDMSLAGAVARYRCEALATDEILGALPLDARPADLDRPGLPCELRDVREVFLHLIEETARHAGHLDIARELLDGRTGLGPR